VKWIGLAARLVVGSIWVVAGVLKLADPASTVRAVRAYQLLPEPVVPLIGHGLPVLEVVVGLCLVAGLFVRTAAGVSSALLTAFVIGIASAWARDLSIDCGCFGGRGGPKANAQAAYPWEIARDVALLLLSALLVWKSPSKWVIRTKESFLVSVGLVAALFLGFAVQTTRDTSGHEASAPAGAVATYAVPAGESGAPVKVTIYEDFLCPFCREFEAASRAALQHDVSDGKAQLQYHVMSFLDPSSTTRYSSRAANALAVVLDTAGPDVAKKFHDLLFENQPAEGSAGLSDDQLIEYAVQAGAQRSQVEGPIKSQRFKQWVVNSNDAASKAGVHGTPTVLVDGQTVGGLTMQDLAAKVESAISAKA
jgi:protein-disulfide isomerase/uncharacterized membrane protein YphA (DoxX/SURF4 family)